MTPLEHSDALLKAQKGQWLMACDTISGVNMGEGGEITFSPGAKFRVALAAADLLWVFCENGLRVTFDRQEMIALDIVK